jgi:hypothetical protein
MDTAPFELAAARLKIRQRHPEPLLGSHRRQHVASIWNARRPVHFYFRES